MLRCFALLATLFAVSAALPVQAATVTVAQLLSNPSSYDGSHVDVTGTIQKFVQKMSHKGNPYVTFSLFSTQCVHVFGFGTASISDGQTITVHGTYTAVKHVNGYTFYHEIDADEGSL